MTLKYNDIQNTEHDNTQKYDSLIATSFETLSVTTFSKMPLKMKVLSVMTLRITTDGGTIMGVLPPSIMTVSIKTLGTMTYQRNDI
jgi:hypothetical protein